MEVADPHRLRQHYLSRFKEFRAGLAKHCGSAGIDFLSLTTDQPYHQALGVLLNTPEAVYMGPNPRAYGHHGIGGSGQDWTD